MAVEKTTIVIDADTRQAERALGSLNSALASLVTVASLSALAKFSDSITNIENKLKLVTQAGQSSNQLFLVMAKSALALGAPLQDVSDLFFRIANNTRDLSLAQTDQVRVTELMMKAFMSTGLGVQEARGALVQFGQALSLGTLRGEELNSILEQAPPIADAIAAKFGVTRGALKVLGEQGKITSKDIIDAILAAGNSIDTAFAQRIPTVTEQLNRMSTALGVAFQQVNGGVNISEAMSLAILKITVALVKVIKFFEEWSGVIKTVLSLLGALAAFSLVGRVLGVIGSALMTLIRGFGTLGTSFGIIAERVAEFGITFRAAGGGLLAFVETVIFTLLPIGRLAKVILGLGAAVAGFMGINSLFPKDKQSAVKEQITLQEELNRLLGLNNVEASKASTPGAGGKTAQQLEIETAIGKATENRNIKLQDILRTQGNIVQATKAQGDELIVQSEINKVNEQLIEAIKDKNGKLIGYTQGLTNLEEQKLRTILLQNEAIKAQNILAQIGAKEGSVAMANRAVGLYGGTQGGIADEAKKQQAALELLKTNRLISDQSYADQSILIEANRANAILQLEQKISEQRMRNAGVTNQAIIDAVKTQMEQVKMIQTGGVAGVQGVLGALDTVYGAMASQNKKAFETHKKLAIAQALISTYQAAAMSIAAPPGPPWSFIYVAGAIAAGMAQIAAIQGQQYSGRALGGPVTGNTPYIVGERGPELFVPTNNGSIIPNNQLNGGGGTNINFNIQANDATGFDDLLIQRRGMITQFVRDAMQETGQRSRM